MMGTKLRNFAPLPDLSLEELVPNDNFYRHLQETLDLSFVRQMVEDRYAPSGRPSVDPVVFFKLQIVLFFEGLRSERQLMAVVADRLSIRWYLGYDLYEPLPDHSSLTRIRDRYGLEVFRRFFEEIVQRCAPRPGWCGAKNSTSTPPRSRRMRPWSRSHLASPSSNTFRISSRKTHKSQTVHRATRRGPLPPKISICFRPRKMRSSSVPTPPRATGSPRRGVRTGK
jgi:transposase